LAGAARDRAFGSAPTLIIGCALVVLALYVGFRVAGPADGTQMLFDVVAPATHGIRLRVYDDASPLRSNDVLVAIDGRSVDDLLSDTVRPRNGGSGDAHSDHWYAVVRDGQPVDASITPGARGSLLPSLVADWPLYAMLLYLAAVGLFTFWKRPDAVAARILGALGIVVLAAQVIQYAGFGAIDLLRDAGIPLLLGARVVMSMLTVSLALHFALVFPARSALLDRGRGVLRAVYAGPWIGYLGIVLVMWPAGATPLTILVSGQRALFTNSALGLAIATAVFFVRAKAAPSDEQRRQTLWVAWGMAVAVVPWLGIIGAAVLMDASVRDVLAPASLTWAAIPTAFSIAIIREGLFDIDLLVRRTLVYGLLTAALAGISAAAIALTQRALLAFTGSESDLAIVVATLVIVAGFTPIKDAIQHQVDSRFKGDSPGVARVRAFGLQVEQRLGAVEPAQVGRRLLETVVESFGLSGGELWLARKRRATAGVGEKPDRRATPIAIETTDGERVGQLRLGPGRNGKALRPNELKITSDVATTVADAIVSDRNAAGSVGRTSVPGPAPSGERAPT
jgi:hypothetical protein